MAAQPQCRSSLLLNFRQDFDPPPARTGRKVSAHLMHGKRLVLSLILASCPLSGTAAGDTPAEKTQAALEMAEALNLKQRMPQLVEAVVTMDIQKNTAAGKSPEEIAKSTRILREFFEHDFDVSVLEKRMAELYAEDFSVEEMKQIILYLKSPAIRKFTATQGSRLVKLNEFMIKDIMEKIPGK
jgi:hypothetical protein